MKAIRLDLKGLLLLEMPIRRDARGFLVERFQAATFAEHGLPTSFPQDNHSRSVPRVLRGLHFQHDPPQGKLVGAMRGRIWDVAVDIRPDSDTFGKSFGVELNDANGHLLWVPPGFAHGFCVLGDEPADVLYKVDALYNPAGEGGIYWNDPDLAIAWPIAEPIISERDQWQSSFADYKARPILWLKSPAAATLVRNPQAV